MNKLYYQWKQLIHEIRNLRKTYNLIIRNNPELEETPRIHWPIEHRRIYFKLDENERKKYNIEIEIKEILRKDCYITPSNTIMLIVDGNLEERAAYNGNEIS